MLDIKVIRENPERVKAAMRGLRDSETNVFRCEPDSDYNFTDTQLVFPVAFGVDEAAADYYARLQAECSAGEHPELLTPTGAALDYARRVTWIFGEDVSATDFERIELVG